MMRDGGRTSQDALPVITTGQPPEIYPGYNCHGNETLNVRQGFQSFVFENR